MTKSEGLINQDMINNQDMNNSNNMFNTIIEMIIDLKEISIQKEEFHLEMKMIEIFAETNEWTIEIWVETAKEIMDEMMTEGKDTEEIRIVITEEETREMIREDLGEMSAVEIMTEIGKIIIIEIIIIIITAVVDIEEEKIEVN
jgi:hypothetical protein